MSGIDPGSLPPGFPIPFDILLFIDGIAPTLRVIIACAVWFGISIPVLLLLFATSTTESRRTALFVANAIALMVAMSLGLSNIVLLMNSVLNPAIQVNRDGTLALAYTLIIIEIFIDSILLMRVFIVFPPRRTPRHIFIAIFGPLVAFKLGRLSIAIVFMVRFARQTVNVENSIRIGELVLTRLEPKIAWLLQIADNSLCSAIFLVKLHKVQSMSARVGGQDGRASFVERLRVLFWIALSNFVFPAFITISVVVLDFTDKDYTHFLLLLISNIFVEAFGVMFATIWATSAKKKEKAEEGTFIPSIRFAPPSRSFSGITSTDSSTTTADNYSKSKTLREIKEESPNPGETIMIS